MDTRDKNNHHLKHPNLFIVGAPKCGTSSLHDWLSQHPEIFMSEPKEPTYFCKDLYKEAKNFNNDKNKYFRYEDKNDYLNLFQGATKEKILGEASTRYLASKTAPLKIKQETINPKIIISLRDPIRFMQSYHSQILNEDENITDFQTALNMERERIRGKNIPSMATCPSFLYYTKLAQFSKFIDYYFSIFDKKNIKIILLDDLRDKPQEIYQDILEFLKVDNTDFIPQFEVKNPNTKLRSNFLKSLWRIYNYTYLKKIYHTITSRSLRKKISFLYKTTQSRSPIDKELELKLKKEFRPEVERLSNITGRDLIGLWGYK